MFERSLRLKRGLAVALLSAPGLFLLPCAANAGEAASITATNSGDTAWMLVSSALVFLMTVPGLALFYGGLVRKKNVLSVLMQCAVAACLVTLQWTMFGYSLAFSPGNGFVGGLGWAGLRDVSHEFANSVYCGSIPHQAFMAFQMMFAIIAPALMIGAFAERMRFGAFCVFIVLWSTLVYDPVAHWIWSGDGFLSALNPGARAALDFAGGTVIHVNAGMAALACAIFLGRRNGYPRKISPPHNLPFSVAGAGLLWFGWFGFNSGSALGANGIAVNAFVVTHVAAAMGGLAWICMDWFFNRSPTVLGVITGIVAGLVSITPAAGFVNVFGAVLTGLGAGVIPWLFVQILKPAMGLDDSLDAFGVHGVGGVWGAVATGLFATSSVNPAGSGAWDGNWPQLLTQLEGVAVTMVFSFAVSYALLAAVDFVFKLRVGEREEAIGLDLTQHRESAYTIID